MYFKSSEFKIQKAVEKSQTVGFVKHNFQKSQCTNFPGKVYQFFRHYVSVSPAFCPFYLSENIEGSCSYFDTQTFACLRTSSPIIYP